MSGHASENYLQQVDTLSSHVTQVQRSLTEENEACSAVSKLLAENEKEYDELKADLQQREADIREMQERESNSSAVDSLQSSLDMYEESKALQENELKTLKDELGCYQNELNHLRQNSKAKLESIRARFAGQLVNNNISDSRARRDQLILMRNSLLTQIKSQRESHSLMSQKDWKEFRKTVVNMAASKIQAESEKRENYAYQSSVQNVESLLRNIQIEISALEKKKQMHNAMFRSPTPSVNQTTRQDTPRPKTLFGISLSLPRIHILPKIKFPFTRERHSISSHGPSGSAEIRKSKSNIMHQFRDTGPAHVINKHTSGTLLSNTDSGISAGSTILRNSSASSLYSGNSCGVTDARNFNTMLLRNQCSSGYIAVSSSESRSNSNAVSPYFESGNIRGSSINSLDTDKSSASNQNILVSGSSVTLIRSKEGEAVTGDQDNPSGTYVWSTPPPSPCVSSSNWATSLNSTPLPNEDARKAYIASLSESPEMTYSKAPPPVKYASRGGMAGRPMMIPSVDEDSPPHSSLISHRIRKYLLAYRRFNMLDGNENTYVEDLTKSGESSPYPIISEKRGVTGADGASDNPQPMETEQADPEQREPTFSSSQGFSVSDESTNCSQQSASDAEMDSYPVDQNAKTGALLTSSLVVEASGSKDASSDQLGSSSIYSGNVLSGPSSSKTSSLHSSSASDHVISSHTLSTQQVLSEPIFFSSPKSTDTANKDIHKANSYTVSLDAPSPINSCASSDLSRSNFFQGAADSFPSFFGTEQRSQSSDCGALSLFGPPLSSQRTNEPDPGKDAVNFSLFGESQCEQDSSATGSFFSFNFGGTSASSTTDSSGGFFSALGIVGSDDNEEPARGSNFRLF